MTEQPPATVDQTGTDPSMIGHPAVDASLRALAEVTDASPAEQLPAYQAAHRTLREILASIDEAEAGPVSGESPRGQRPAEAPRVPDPGGAPRDQATGQAMGASRPAPG
jgi:hypothetical protein